MEKETPSKSTDRAERYILCVGMCVLDIIHVCEQFPTEDTDKRCLNGYWQRGGNASNNCTVLRQLGATSEFLGMLSSSPAFGFLLDDCSKRGIRIENCPFTEKDPPFSSVILVKATDSRTIIHSNSNFPILRYMHFSRIDLSAYSWIHFEGRNPQETLQMLSDIHAYNDRHDDKIQISVELEKVRLEILVLADLADYIFFGKDLAQHLGWNDAHTAVFGLQKMLEKRTSNTIGGHVIICTWGAKGSSCLDANNVYTHVPPVPPNEIVDTLGAGDTFCAATIYALSHLKYKITDALAFSNCCAGYKLGHTGYDAVKDFKQQHTTMVRNE